MPGEIDLRGWQRAYGRFGQAEEWKPGVVVFGPELTAKIGETDGRIKGFTAEVSENAKSGKFVPPAAWQARWTSFLGRWKAFQDDWWFFATTKLHAYLTLAREFDDILGSYKKSAEGSGVEVTTTPTPLPRQEDQSLFNRLAESAKKGAWIAGGLVVLSIVGLVVVPLAIGAVRGAARPAYAGHRRARALPRF